MAAPGFKENAGGAGGGLQAAAVRAPPQGAGSSARGAPAVPYQQGRKDSCVFASAANDLDYDGRRQRERRDNDTRRLARASADGGRKAPAQLHRRPLSVYPPSVGPRGPPAFPPSFVDPPQPSLHRSTPLQPPLPPHRPGALSTVRALLDELSADIHGGALLAELAEDVGHGRGGGLSVWSSVVAGAKGTSSFTLRSPACSLSRP